MKVSISRFDPERKTFNVDLSGKEGAEPFLTIKGCRVVDGSKGQFVGWPARKDDRGKWWSHCWASDAFQSAVLAEVAKVVPQVRKTADDEAMPW